MGRSGRGAGPKSITEDPIIPAREEVKDERKDLKPFYPARAPSSGKFCFNKCPEYLEDPEEERYKDMREAALKAQAVGATPFKPSGTKSSKNTRTIVFHQAGVRM